MYRCALVCGVVAAAASAACAGVTWTSARVEVIDPPASVQEDALEENGVAFVFEEGDGHVLAEDLPLDHVQLWEGALQWPASAVTPGIVPAGSAVRSYYVHFDGIEAGSAGQFLQELAIRFDEEVIGVITDRIALTDFPLEESRTAYPPEPVIQYEIRRTAISADRRTLRFSPSIYDSASRFRVITTVGESSAPDCFDALGCEFDRDGVILPVAQVLSLVEAGDQIFASGEFARPREDFGQAQWVMQYEQGRWTALGGCLDCALTDLAWWDDLNGGTLFMAGEFDSPGGSDHIAQWSGGSIESLASTPGGIVAGIAVHERIGARGLYAAVRAAAGFEWQVRRWDGTAWAHVGPRIAGTPTRVISAGGELYVCGQVIVDDDVSGGAIRLTESDGWELVGENGLIVRDMAMFDDGSGPELVAVGFFRNPDGTAHRGAAALRNGAWEPLGETFDAEPQAMAAGESIGGGPALYIGGGFTRVGDRSAIGAAMWDGASWSSLGGGLVGGPVLDMVASDAHGLVLGGRFTRASYAPAYYIAAWRGCGLACAADVSGDGVVGFEELNAVLAQFGAFGDGLVGDINGDGFVDFGDLNAVLVAFGPCPASCAYPPGGVQDCNANGIPDTCDVAEGISLDENNNAVPDECDPDCNSNGVPDDVDVQTGTSHDCNGNGIPDECDVSSGFSPDCNNNGVPDDCDIAAGTSEDLNGNGVPDECDPDCNGNGTPDDIDIMMGASEDCDANGVPDECDPDCNGNDAPDGCDIVSGFSADCNGNGVPDTCDIDSGFSRDCNGNGVPDACDIDSGFSQDCNDNGVPDACDIASGFSADCNGNSVPDACEIASGAASDLDGNGVIDDCQKDYCPGDVTGDGLRNNSDLNLVLAAFGQPVGAFPQADVNRDGIIDFSDVQILLVFFGVPCAGG